MEVIFRCAAFAFVWWMALLFAGEAAWAGEVQNTPIRYSLKTQYTSRPYQFNFPYLRLESSVAAEQINALLHHLELETLPPEAADPQTEPELQNLDSNPGRANANLEGISQIRAGKIETIYDGRVLLIPMSRASCGGSYSSARAFMLLMQKRVGC